MRRLNSIPAIKIVKKYLPIILIIALAVFLRFYKFQNKIAFDADQEELAFRAKDLLLGDPVLLGQKTSLGGYSIGPGFVYLWAIASLLMKGDPAAGGVVSALLGVLVTTLLYLFGRKIYSDKAGIIMAFLSSISVGFIFWDQIAWAPSLFYLAEMIILYGGFISSKSKYGIAVIAFGFALGFQSHFDVFLLVLPLMIYLLLFKPVVTKKWLVVSLLILLAGFLPVLVFDMTHRFVNIGRLFNIFLLSVSGGGLAKTKIVNAFFSEATAIIWPYFPKLTQYSLMLVAELFSVWGIIRDKSNRKILVLSNLLLIIPFILFLFYRSNFTEYYLMTTTVASLFIFGYVFQKLNKYLLMLFIIPVIYLNMNSYISEKKPMNLHAKKSVVEQIVKIGGKEGYGISIATDLGYNFGYKYILDYYDSKGNYPPLKDQKKIFTIVSPPKYRGIESMYEIDGIGLRWEGY